MLPFLQSAFGEGVEAHKLTILQVVLRSILIFFATLLVVRAANKRFFAKRTAFDVILALILGSMMARAINGSERLVPTVVGGFVLAFLHRGLGWMSCHWPATRGWIKGHGDDLVEHGALNRQAMDRHNLGLDDLEEEFRLQGVLDPDQIQRARLERNGQVSVIRKKE